MENFCDSASFGPVSAAPVLLQQSQGRVQTSTAFKLGKVLGSPPWICTCRRLAPSGWSLEARQSAHPTVSAGSQAFVQGLRLS